MKIVKLFVLLCCIFGIKGYKNEYCEICRDHTLCMYPVNGPSAECRAFDKEALLTGEDIMEILDRINTRRNMVATGQLNRMPQAANMKKIRWSKELATFAQRWADQCDSSIRPDREDRCRDFANLTVGQSIATVSGPTSGLSVRSFIDLWFVMKLRYIGNVVYYNQSRDENSKHFTQLMWANTEYVGCGKVKFFNQELNNIVERLVCNFAPKGNIHGKPVYAIGYPATQCPDPLQPDTEYPGLCSFIYGTEIEKSVTLESSPVSLLRILDLSNNSVKRDLDPNNLKQTNYNSSEINQRYQKTRHVYFNNSLGSYKRDSFHMQNPLNDPENYIMRTFSPERGHSRMYHGHQTQKPSAISVLPIVSPSPDASFKRYDLTNAPYIYSSQARRNFGAIARDQCTRKPKACYSTPCVINQCTRGGPHQYQLNLAPHSYSSCMPPFSSTISPGHQKTCPCNQQTKCSSQSPQCDCNAKCQCVNHNNCPIHEQTTCCAKPRAGDQSTQFNYYDLFPNIGMKSGDTQAKALNNPEKDIYDDYYNRETKLSSQVKAIDRNMRSRLRHPQDSFDVLYSSERKRRDFEDQTFRPFWQMDEYNYKRPPELKSLRYTTLGNRNNKKTRRHRLQTESITLQRDNDYHDNRHDDHVTEKYLSFEELMRLRKLSTQDVFDYDARRVGEGLFLRTTKKAAATTKKSAATTKKTAATTKKAATTTTKKAAHTTKAATTTKKPTTKATTKAHVTKAATTTTTKKKATTTTITANTPFIRVKQCTRKLTCTWTAATVTLIDGRGVISGGGGIDMASRTPKGYVDGCTRTSTCTRDYLDRNKYESTTKEPEHENTEETTPEDDDGDYCEKRSLDIQKRNVASTIISNVKLNGDKKESNLPEVTTTSILDSKKPDINKRDFISFDGVRRVKREDSNNNARLINRNCKNMKLNKVIKSVYEEPYLSMFQKKTKNLRHHCPCNGCKSIPNRFYWVILLKYSFTWMCYKVFMS